MPFIRQIRDKRGFEQTCVLHNGRPGSGHQRPRVLYVFRTPANLRVGRRVLDAEVREALEHTHPDLNFDWNALTRDAVVSRPDPPQQRPQRNRPTQPPPQSPPAPPIPQELPEDYSLLGKTLGAAAAARLRARFGEVSQRIARRSRTPEERESLLERARLLNPDNWDEAAIRERAASIEAELDSLASALPSRRRGRRGGRHRHEPTRDGGPAGASVIMADDGDRNENPHDSGLDRPAGAPDTGGDAGVSPADPEATDVQIDD